MLSRRGLLGTLIAAPAIVRAASLMPVCRIILYPGLQVGDLVGIPLTDGVEGVLMPIGVYAGQGKVFTFGLATMDMAELGNKIMIASSAPSIPTIPTGQYVEWGKHDWADHHQGAGLPLSR